MFDQLFCAGCVHAMPLDDFIIWLVIALLGTGFSLLSCQRSFKRARLIEDMPTSKIRSASQGYTELVAIALLKGEPLIAPLTTQPCLWWFYEIERYKSSGKSSHWVTVEKQSSDSPFYIQDTTGVCQVQPEGAEISCKHKRVWHGRSRRPAGSTAPDSSGVFRLGRITSGLTIGKRYRYTEKLIKAGDPIYTLGHFQTDKDGIRSLTPTELTGNILRHWKQDFNKLIQQFDSNNDGELSVKEWEAVKKAAEKEAQRQRQANAQLAPQHSLSKPAERGLPFLIGSTEQTSLVKRFRWQAIGFSIAFIASGSLSTWLISSRFIA